MNNIRSELTRFFFVSIITIVSILTIPVSTFAQSDSEVSVSETPEVRVPSPSRLEEISKMDKYLYNEPREELSFWDKLWIRFMNKVGEILSNKWVEYFLKGSALLIFVAILIALINQMLKGEIRSAIGGKKERTLLNLRAEDGTSTSKDIDKLIQDALAKKRFSLAVRLLYQKSLVLLKEKELIQFKQDKTNYDYLRELEGHASASLFDRLTYFHEYIDYGHFDVDEQRFLKVQSVYKQFEDSLNA